MSQISFPETAKQEQLNPITQDSIQNPHYQEYLKLSEKEWTFADLLPMDKEQTLLADTKQKIKVLNLLQCLYEEASHALYSFYIDKRLDLFDAHVGESSCQIRAIKLILLLKNSNCTITMQAEKKIQAFKVYSDQILSLIKSYHSSRYRIEGKILLSHLLKKYHLNDTLDANDLFLISCYVLKKFKRIVSIDKDVVDYKKIETLWKTSKSQTEKIACHLQRICSLLSVSYVYRHVNNQSLTHTMLAYLLQKDDVDRWVLPSLEITQVFLELMHHHSIPVYLNIMQHNNHGKYLGHHYLLQKSDRFDRLPEAASCLSEPMSTQAGIVFHGFVYVSPATNSYAKIISKLTEFKFDFMVECSAASHLQYPGDRLKPYAMHPYDLAKGYLPKDYLVEKTNQLRHYQASALYYGLCKSSPTTLAIAHIAAGHGHDLHESAF